ncbi:hypothetical protein CF336_g7745 [Tilletia laevis]|uniref:Uncharacterized protein n=1 Tax=Tilletia caries TaxID=13290 RepID=A0A177V3G7_9BASI|nr:hypothetical protein CF336_g7745 [Tilletia laevis]KAE8187227.1 hypothetical protein CF335_g7234 [Tilletia laevis]KAE8262685.1 hypothetical protein A4X03_0g2265 [Tilletia caries]
MFYPRFLFFLPYLVLLLATAANSAPVPDTKGCTSCPNLPRTLQARGWWDGAGRILNPSKWFNPNRGYTKLDNPIQETKAQLGAQPFNIHDDAEWAELQGKHLRPADVLHWINLRVAISRTEIELGNARVELQRVTEGSSENRPSQIDHWKGRVTTLEGSVARLQEERRALLLAWS